MKPLRPSLREKKRYLYVKGNNLKKNIPDSILEFLGVLGMSDVSLNFIKGGKDYSVISINREALDKVRASFCVSSEGIEVIKVSGTLKALGINTK